MFQHVGKNEWAESTDLLIIGGSRGTFWMHSPELKFWEEVTMIQITLFTFLILLLSKNGKVIHEGMPCTFYRICLITSRVSVWYITYIESFQFFCFSVWGIYFIVVRRSDNILDFYTNSHFFWNRKEVRINFAFCHLKNDLCQLSKTFLVH